VPLFLIWSIDNKCGIGHLTCGAGGGARSRGMDDDGAHPRDMAGGGACPPSPALEQTNTRPRLDDSVLKKRVTRVT
jgi:hypothetical protein